MHQLQPKSTTSVLSTSAVCWDSTVWNRTVSKWVEGCFSAGDSDLYHFLWYCLSETPVSMQHSSWLYSKPSSFGRKRDADECQWLTSDRHCTRYGGHGDDDCDGADDIDRYLHRCMVLSSTSVQLQYATSSTALTHCSGRNGRMKS